MQTNFQDGTDPIRKNRSRIAAMLASLSLENIINYTGRKVNQ